MPARRAWQPVQEGENFIHLPAMQFAAEKPRQREFALRSPAACSYGMHTTKQSAKVLNSDVALGNWRALGEALNCALRHAFGECLNTIWLNYAHLRPPSC